MVAVLWAAAAVLAVLVVRCSPGVLRAWRLLRHQRRLAAGIPGPTAYPLIGNLLYFLTPLDGLFGVFNELCVKHGYLFRGWFGPFLAVAVMDAEDLQVVMTSPHVANKPAAFYQGPENVLGKGLITINGSDYKRHRKAITNSMHLDILQEFVVIFSASCRVLEARLDPRAEAGQAFDVVHDLGYIASTSVCKTILAAEAPGLEAERDACVETVHDASLVMMYRALRPWFRSNVLFKLSSWHDRYYRVLAGITNFADRVLTQKIQMLQQSGSSPPSLRRKTFLDTFLASPEASVLSRDELLAELKTMLFAGIGTSMDFLSTFLLCMSLHPEVQRKVQQELDNVFGALNDRDIVATDLPHLQYLECALKEALRFFPPAPAFCRVATQDVQLPSGHVLPKGCIVGIFPLWTHRNPRYFPDPERFNPDRFTPENSRNRHPFAFIPFSAGLRSCLGQRYAMMFAKTVAASVLRRYDVLPDPHGPRTLLDVHLVAGITMSVKGGVRIRLRRRELQDKLLHSYEVPPACTAYGL